MTFQKPLMTITELCEMGFSKRQLKRYVHIPGFPANKMSAAKNSPWLVDTEKFGPWWERYGGRV